MKKIILLFLWLVLVSGRSVRAENIDNPQIRPEPVIKWGNSSYHDSLGARDPWVLKDNGTIYLYYDCIEDLYNPSFETNMGTNGWETYEANISSSSERALFGQKSLRINANPVVSASAYTGDYYYSNIKNPANLAAPAGLEVTPNTYFIASAYFWGDANTTMDIIVQQYRNDPMFNYWGNLIQNANAISTIQGNNNWQRIFVKFQTRPETRAITISLGNHNAVTTTSFWDGIQLERIGDTQNDPSDFPQDVNFDKSIENTAGWKTCVATSTDGINFQKKGLVEIQGTVENWQNFIKPGYVGSDSNQLYIFPYQNKWYAYSWVNGYLVNPNNPNVLDRGQNSVRRFGYEDRRIFFPGGGSARSGLLVSDSPLGPFQRIPSGGPLTHPTNEQQCQTGSQIGINKPWGCDYTAASGVPNQIDNHWVLFLSGMGGINASSTYNGMYNGVCRGDGINAGLAISDNPFGPWTAADFNPLFPANEVCQEHYALIPEGPIYYYDRPSGNHVIFVNQLNDMSITAYYTKNPITNWPAANRKIIIGNTTYSWYPEGVVKMPNSAAINLATVLEENNKLNLYFGYKEINGHNGLNIGNYLFHNIGLLSLELPLFPALPTPTPTSTPIPSPSFTPTSTPPPAPTPLPGDRDKNGKVNISDYTTLLQNFGNTACNNVADIDGTCIVDIFDYNILVGGFGK